jgi:HlyD family secretion protein
VYAEGTGKLTGILVGSGDTVKQGELLASMDKTSLELQLGDAKAKVSGARAQLKGTDIANYANKIEIAEASVERAEIANESALRTYDNVKQLYDKQTATKEQLDKAQDACREAAVGLEAAQSELNEIKRGTPDSVKEGYKALLEQAVISRDMISDSIKKQEIRASIGGVVLEKLIEDNSYIMPGTPAFVIGDPKNLELSAEILADDAAGLSIGNAVEASGKAASGNVVKGRITKIAPAAKTVVSALGVNQKRVPVTIELEGDISFLKPGYELDIKIVTQSRSDVLAVPDTAVFDYNGSSSVFVVEDGKTTIRKITKGIEAKDSIEVSDGLRQGEKILVKPENGVREGMRVQNSFD